MDTDRLEVRALGALAAAGGPEVTKRDWRRLVALGVPIGETLQDAVVTLEAEGLAERRGGEILVGEVNGGSLAEVVEPFFGDPEGSPTQQRHLRVALAQLYRIDPPVTADQVVGAARETPLAEATLLPARVREHGEAQGWNDMGLRQRVSAARTAIEHAIFRGRVPGFSVPAEWLEAVPHDAETEAILEALAELWVRGETPTQERVCEMTFLNPGTYYRRVHALKETGRAQTNQVRQGEGLVAINSRGVDPEQVTLATVVREADLEQHSRALGAIRDYLGLPLSGRRDVEAIAEAAEATPLDRLRHLPELVYDHLLAQGRSKGTGKVSASAVRSLLREAAAEGRIPMIWTSPWEEARDAWIPRTRGRIEGASYRQRMVWRWALGHLREAAIDLWGPEASPYELTEDGVEEVRHWLRKRGRWDHAAGVVSALRYAGRRGYGPYASMAERLGNPALPGVGPSVKTLDGMIETLRAHGLGDEWEQFLRDLTDWSTLPAKQVRTREGLPPRPKARRVGSMRYRYEAIRLVLGVLRRLGHDLSDLSPHEAFAHPLFSRAINEAVALWEARHEAGELSSPCGTGLKNAIASAGIVADYLYRVERHRRGEEVSDGREGKPTWGTDPEQEEEAVKTEREDALWRSYRHSCEIGDELREEREQYATGQNGNTEKDIAEVLEAAPPQLYEDLVAAYHRLARESLERDGESLDHHRLILHAFVLCALVSTGARGQELAHLRCDVHLPDEFFDAEYDGPITVTLQRFDRKNKKEHKVRLWPELVPAWLRMSYLASREALMRRGGLRHPESGELVEEATSWEARRWPAAERFGLEEGEWHQHLLVFPADGSSVGDPGEDRRGRRSLSAEDLEKRVNRLRDQWKNHAGRVLWRETGRECPTDDGVWTFHTIRNVMGYALYQQSELDAENYLGDALQAIRAAYSGVSGDHISAETFRRAVSWAGGEVERGEEGEA